MPADVVTSDEFKKTVEDIRRRLDEIHRHAIKMPGVQQSINGLSTDLGTLTEMVRKGFAALGVTGLD